MHTADKGDFLKLNNKKNGFTLLEVVVVVIIVGILASLSVPRMFNIVSFSVSVEALNSMGAARRQAERCASMAGGMTSTPQWATCITFANIGINDPGDAPGSSFTYTISPVVAGFWTITATCSAAHCAGSEITLEYDTMTGTSNATGGCPSCGVGNGIFDGLDMDLNIPNT